MLTRLIILACLVLQFFLPWWIIGPVAFIFAAWKARTATHAFQSGFKALFVLWTLMALIKTLPNDNILANRVGKMFMLPDWSFNWIFVLLVSSLTGALTAAFSALAGYYCGTVVKNISHGYKR